MNESISFSIFCTRRKVRFPLSRIRGARTVFASNAKPLGAFIAVTIEPAVFRAEDTQTEASNGCQRGEDLLVPIVLRSVSVRILID